MEALTNEMEEDRAKSGGEGTTVFECLLHLSPCTSDVTKLSSVTVI